MKPVSAFVFAAALGLLVVAALVHPAPVSAEERCLPGMERSEDTYGQCCWPGQVWTGSACVGRPSRCPAGFKVVATGCEEQFLECPTGQVVMSDQAHCCWPGQSWSGGACAGDPTCPEGQVGVGASCEPIPTCSGGQELTVDGAHCCWPGQGWSRSRGACLGFPTTCPSGSASRENGCARLTEMVEVPAGPFWMGCSSLDSDCRSDEHPGHEVTLPLFSIEKTEVTVSQFGACVDAGLCEEPRTRDEAPWNWGQPGRDAHPVNGVRWRDAVAYCGWVGRRLPTEVEWEKAARGTDGRMYPWGNEPATCAQAVMDEGGDGCGTGTTAAVGSRPSGASPYGALDMAGNLWEWTADRYLEDAYGSAPGSKPWNHAKSAGNVRRGGCFSDPARGVRAGLRGYYPIMDSSVFRGFRCAR